MSNMYSIGELVDKLIIENIKIFSLREKIHGDVSDEEYVECENKMNILNENRGVIIDFMNDKIDRVIEGKEPNQSLRNVKTYARSEE